MKNAPATRKQRAHNEATPSVVNGQILWCCFGFVQPIEQEYEENCDRRRMAQFSGYSSFEINSSLALNYLNLATFQAHFSLASASSLTYVLFFIIRNFDNDQMWDPQRYIILFFLYRPCVFGSLLFFCYIGLLTFYTYARFRFSSTQHNFFFLVLIEKKQTGSKTN